MYMYFKKKSGYHYSTFNQGKYILAKKNYLGFPGGSVVKNFPAVRDLGLIPGLGRCPGEGNGSPLWYSCLDKSMNRGGWQATIHAKSWTN